MKLGVRGTLIVLISGAIVLILGLVFAPRLSSEDSVSAIANPTDLEISEAIALVEGGENPMQGIMKLRGVLEKDSTNVDVHWHLAQFSITSRQFENASFRFGKVIEYDHGAKYPDAYFWLAQTKIALGQRQEAVPLLEKYLTLETDTVILKGVENMLYELTQDSINVLN